MPIRVLFVAIALFIPACVAAQEDTGAASDVEAIHDLIERYTKAVDTVDLNLLSQIWSHSPEVSFIYPLGEEHGFEAIEQHIFKNLSRNSFQKQKSGCPTLATSLFLWLGWDTLYLQPFIVLCSFL